jgi:uncharacterized protein (TIGR00251 family)
MKIQVKVKANSKTEEIIQDGEAVYSIKVKAAAKEGKANLAVIKLLAQEFNIPKSNIRIISGLKARNKLIEMQME